MPVENQISPTPTEPKPLAGELRSSEIRYRRLFESARDGILILDGESRQIIDVNPYMIEFLSYSREEFLGKELFEIGLLADEAACQQVYADLKNKGYVRYDNLPLKTKSGESWEVEFVCNLYDEDGQQVAQCNIRDITARRKAEEALHEIEERYRLLAENSLDLIGLLDWEGTVLYASPSHYQVLGYAPAEMEGHNIFGAIHPDDAAVAGAAVGELKKSGQNQTVELRLGRKDGRWLEVEVNLSLIPGENEKRILLSARDISIRKQIEEALLASRDEAERANLAKSEFLSRMSHELRTPMNAILGFGQLLEMDDLKVGQRQGIEQILKGGRHLLQLIDEVLDISSIESGQFPLALEPIHVGEVAQEAAELVQTLLNQSGIRFENNIDLGGCHVTADRQRLKQILLNLLSNAIKYNRKDGQVRLSCAQRGERVRFEISDTGAGISREDQGKLFVPFERLNAAEKGVEGNGIGLSICQRLVEIMGGTIGLESTLGGGSTFWVELPGAQNPATLLNRNEAAGRSPEDGAAFEVGEIVTYCVLCVEDNPSNLELVEQILARRPAIGVLTATRAQRGLELARERRPSLILLDFHLPDLLGDEVLQQLRADSSTRNIPVVMLSADATPRQIERMLQAGAQGYVTKPLDVKQFLQVIDETLAKGTE